MEFGILSKGKTEATKCINVNHHINYSNLSAWILGE